MSQVPSINVENAGGGAVRADLNLILLALASQNSGPTAPSTTYAFMMWADTTANRIKIRNAANSAWITLPLSITASDTVPDNLSILGTLSAVEPASLGVAGANWLLDPDDDASGARLRIGPTVMGTLAESLGLTINRTTGLIEIGKGTAVSTDKLDVYGGVKMRGGKLTFPNGSEQPVAGVVGASCTVVDAISTMTNSSTWETVISASYTPKKTGNLLLITASIHAACYSDAWWQIRNGSTMIMAPASPGTNRVSAHGHVIAVDLAYVRPSIISKTVMLAAPAATAQTISVAARCRDSGYPLYINRRVSDLDTNTVERGVSTLTIVEVAQ